MSALIYSLPNDESSNITTTESTCSEFSRTKAKKSYVKKPIKTGEWDRNEVVKFFTCTSMYNKYKIPWKFLIKYIESRTVQQVYNKIKISSSAIKFVNDNFWMQYSESDFSAVAEKNYEVLFSQIKAKILIYLSANSKNIFHTKKQKINSIPKIQKHLFTFSEVEKGALPPFWQDICKNISIEIGNEDYFAFINLNGYAEDGKVIKIDEKSFMQFLLTKKEN